MKPDGIYGFICELRRRKIYRAAAAYVVAGWLIIQVAAVVFPILELPAWSVRIVVVTVLAGFPLVLARAWAFDLGPHGIHKSVDSATDPHCPPAFIPARSNLIALVFAGAAISALCGYFLLSHHPSTILDKSVAVLPGDVLRSHPRFQTLIK